MDWEDFKEIFTVFLTIVLLLLLVFGLVGGIIAIISYKSSCESARIYNSQHKTSYTCTDFFWAKDQINQQTQTINLNNK